MRKRKVFQLIESLQPKERRKLEKWLEYELSEKQESVLHLYRLLIKHTNIKKVWKGLYPERSIPDKPLQDVQFRRLENHLTERIGTFLAIRQFRKDESMRDLYLIKALNERPKEEIFLPEFNKIKKRLESTRVKNGEYYMLRYLLEREFQYYRVKHKSQNYSLDPEYDALLDTWWLHEKIRIANIGISRGRKEKPSPILAFAMQLIREEDRYQEMPMLQIYQQQYNLHVHDEESHQIPEWLWLFRDWLNPKERYDIFVNLTNYYIKKHYQTKDPYFRKQLYLLDKWGIDEKINFLDGYLTWTSYHIFCTMALVYEPIEEFLNIIDSYKELVSPTDREEVYQFHLGKYHYAIRDYRNAKRAFNQRFSRPVLERAGRTMLLVCRYENGERVELENEIRAFSVWLERQASLSKALTKSSLNFLKALSKLIDYQENKHREYLSRVIESESNITNKNWLKEKFREVDSILA
ncbi:MAG: hypothetical protein AAFQ87_09185 [Bacteroidota bacterium]